MDNLKSFKKHTTVGMWSLTGTVMEELKRTTPRSDKPGKHLADQYRRIMKKDTEGYVSEVIISNTTNMPELIWWLEHGTSPHVIHGRPLLVFEVKGKLVFTTIVHHPGTKPYRFIATARRNLEMRLDKFRDEVARRTARQVVSGSRI